MASYSQNTNNVMPILVMALLCLISGTHAGDNDTLVSQMCAATYAPNICQSCIKKDHNGGKSDSDVIQVMLTCANNDVLTLEKDVNKALDDPKTDQKTKDALFACNPLISNFTQAGGLVQQQAMERKFAEARATIKNVVMPNMAQCDNLLAAPGVNIPPAVFSGFFIVESDYKLSDQLMATVKS